jgi:hypothetical protein
MAILWTHGLLVHAIVQKPDQDHVAFAMNKAVGSWNAATPDNVLISYEGDRPRDEIPMKPETS